MLYFQPAKPLTRRVLLWIGLGGALSALFLPAVFFMGELSGWRTLYVSASTLFYISFPPAFPAERRLDTLTWRWLFASALWLPALVFVAAARHLGRTQVSPSVPFRMAAVLALLVTAAAPLVLPGRFLIGFWFWLLSLASVVAALLLPAPPRSGANTA